MRMKWIDLYKSVGYYESEVFDISSDFNYYRLVESISYIKNGGTFDISIRVSYDGGRSWGKWISLIYNIDDLFDNEFPLGNAKMQYRVDMSGDESHKPIFKNLRLDLYGGLRIMNTGDIVCRPEIWIKKTNGSGNITLINHTNSQTVELKNLNNGEEVYIHNEFKDIVSSLPNKYRYEDHNGVFLKLEVGENVLTGTGDFSLDVKLEFKTLQG